VSALAWIIHLAALAACLAAPLPLAWALAIRCRARSGAAHLLLAAGCWWLLVAALAVVATDLCGPLTVARVLMVEALAAFAGLRLWLRDRERAAQAATTLRTGLAGIAGWSAPERWTLAAVACAGLGAAAAMIATPSSDYDTWMYQLPQVAESIQHASLEARQEQWLDKQTYERGILYYPGDWSAVSWLATAPLGRDTATLLPNLVAWLVLGLAARGLALRVGASRANALAAAALAMLMPLCARNLHSAHVDLALGAELAAMLYFCAEGVAAGGRAERWLALALGGLLIGTKMSGIGMIAAPVLLAGWLWRGRTPGTGRREVLLATIAIVSVAVLGASWYARNWQLTGNPLGFVAMRVFGHDLPGVIDHAYIAQTSLLHAFSPLRPYHWWLLGGSVALFCAPVVAWSLWSAPRTLALLRRSRDARALAAVGALLLWLYVAGPWSGKHAHDADLSWWMGQQLRYTVGLWAVVAAFAAGAAGDDARWRWLAPALAVAAAGAFPLMTYGWAIAAPVTILVGILAYAFATRPRSLRLAAAAALIALAVLPAADVLRWRLLDARTGGVPMLLAGRLAPGEPIAFWGSHQSWLLYGRDLRRPVRYAELEDCADGEMLAWMLRARGCAWIAIGPKWRDFAPERYRLVEDRPDLFERVHGDPQAWGMAVYRLRADSR
jgi:hypothetical protein